MKKFIIVAFMSAAFMVNGQTIYADFTRKDSDSWFNKELCFVAINKSVWADYYGNRYGQDISRAAFLVNGTEWYYVDGGTWFYDHTIVIDSPNIKKGSTVSLYINGRFVNSWTCNRSDPYTSSDVKTAYRAYKIGKKVAKLLRKIR